MGLSITAFAVASLLAVAAGSSGFGSSSMPPTVLTLQMIIDFAKLQGWKQVIVFDCIGNNDCTRPYAKALVQCFETANILVAIKPMTDQTDLSKILRVETHRVGVILLLDDIDLNLSNNMLRRVNKMIGDNNLRSTIFGDYASWLLVSTKWNSSQIYDAVRDWPIGVDSDVSVAMSFLDADVISTVYRQFSNK